MEYCLNAVPLGGYVAFPDDDPTNGSFDPEDPNLLKNRPIPQVGGAGGKRGKRAVGTGAGAGRAGGGRGRGKRAGEEGPMRGPW